MTGWIGKPAAEDAEPIILGKGTAYLYPEQWAALPESTRRSLELSGGVVILREDDGAEEGG